MVEGAPHEYKERPGKCADCGNSPVNHFEHYVSNTLAVWTSQTLVSKRGLLYALTKIFGEIFDKVEQWLLRAIAAMPFSSFSSDVQQATTYRSQVVWEEAQRRGIIMEQLRILGRGTEVYRAKLARKWFYFQSLPIPYDKRGESAQWLDDKFLLKQLLKASGVAVPTVHSVSTEKSLLNAFNSMRGPVVIKPRSGSRGRHTSVRVSDEIDAKKAYDSARKLCRYVVIEEYIEGPVCRGTVVDGKLVGFFCADAPYVAGNGRSDIAQLIEEQNGSRHQRVQAIVLTPEHERFIARQGFASNSVPQSGERVKLTHRTGRLFGGTTREMLGCEHPKLRAYLERAAATLGVGVVGFDLIIADPQSDPDEQKWGIIEANSLPYIDLHYLALEGEPSIVASAVWDLWGDSMHMGALDDTVSSATMRA